MNIVIIGSGSAATSALRVFVKWGRGTNVCVVSESGNLPYSPVLLPYYVVGRISRDRLFLHDGELFQQRGVRVILGRKAIGLDPNEKKIVLSDGRALCYDKLLITTGSSPRIPSIKGIKAKGVFVLRNLEDADKMARELGDDVAILGTGLISLELATLLKEKGIKVKVVGRSRIMRRLVDPDISDIIANMLIQKGIELYLNKRELEICGNPVEGLKADGLELECDSVLIAMGVRPNTDFVGDVLEIGESGGIIVDCKMRTSDKHIYAAGDCAETTDLISGRRGINAIWPDAIEQGRIAALNILGLGVDYPGSVRMNILSIFGIPVASIGSVEGEEKVTTASVSSLRRFTLREGKVIGAQFIGDISEIGKIISAIRRGILTKRDLPLHDFLGYAAAKRCTA